MDTCDHHNDSFTYDWQAAEKTNKAANFNRRKSLKRPLTIMISPLSPSAALQNNQNPNFDNNKPIEAMDSGVVEVGGDNGVTSGPLLIDDPSEHPDQRGESKMEMPIMPKLHEVALNQQEMTPTRKKSEQA